MMVTAVEDVLCPCDGLRKMASFSVPYDRMSMQEVRSDKRNDTSSSLFSISQRALPNLQPSSAKSGKISSDYHRPWQACLTHSSLDAGAARSLKRLINSCYSRVKVCQTDDVIASGRTGLENCVAASQVVLLLLTEVALQDPTVQVQVMESLQQHKAFIVVQGHQQAERLGATGLLETIQSKGGSQAESAVAHALLQRASSNSAACAATTTMTCAASGPSQATSLPMSCSSPSASSTASFSGSATTTLGGESPKRAGGNAPSPVPCGPTLEWEANYADGTSSACAPFAFMSISTSLLKSCAPSQPTGVPSVEALVNTLCKFCAQACCTSLSGHTGASVSTSTCLSPSSSPMSGKGGRKATRALALAASCPEAAKPTGSTVQACSDRGSDAQDATSGGGTTHVTPLAPPPISVHAPRSEGGCPPDDKGAVIEAWLHHAYPDAQGGKGAGQAPGAGDAIKEVGTAAAALQHFDLIHTDDISAGHAHAPNPQLYLDILDTPMMLEDDDDILLAPALALPLAGGPVLARSVSGASDAYDFFEQEDLPGTDAFASSGAHSSGHCDLSLPLSWEGVPPPPSSNLSLSTEADEDYWDEDFADDAEGEEEGENSNMVTGASGSDAHRGMERLGLEGSMLGVQKGPGAGAWVQPKAGLEFWGPHLHHPAGDKPKQRKARTRRLGRHHQAPHAMGGRSDPRPCSSGSSYPFTGTEPPSMSRPTEGDREMDEDADMVDCGSANARNRHAIRLTLNIASVLESWQGPIWSTPTGGGAPGCDIGSLATAVPDVSCYPAIVADLEAYLGLALCGREDPEARGARILRYREKRRTRCFNTGVHSEMRRANALKRPRVKGRFVKVESC